MSARRVGKIWPSLSMLICEFAMRAMMRLRMAHASMLIVDANGDGIITQHEFVKFALKSTFLLEVIENHTG